MSGLQYYSEMQNREAANASSEDRRGLMNLEPVTRGLSTNEIKQLKVQRARTSEAEQA